MPALLGAEGLGKGRQKKAPSLPHMLGANWVAKLNEAPSIALAPRKRVCPQTLPATQRSPSTIGYARRTSLFYRCGDGTPLASPLPK